MHNTNWLGCRLHPSFRCAWMCRSFLFCLRIDRKIGGTDAQMPEVKQTHEQSANTLVNATYEPTEPHPEPVPRKIRKSGTGCLYQINDNLWEGSFFPRLPNGKRKKFNVYAETKEQCEIKLAEMIEKIKAEIAEEKATLKEGDS